MVEGDAECTAFVDLFNVFIGGFVEVFQKRVANQDENARLVCGKVAPEGSKVFGVVPGCGVVFG